MADLESMSLAEEVTLLVESTGLSHDAIHEKDPPAPKSAEDLVTKVVAHDMALEAFKDAVLAGFRRLADEIERRDP